MRNTHIVEDVHLSDRELILRTVLLVLGSSVLFHAVSRIITQLYFHPLSCIPGPKLAAISDWYRFYYNFIVDGQYSKSFPRLHQKYESPVIRIGPNAVHVNDLDFYEEVFALKTNYYKEPTFYQALGAEGAMASILDPKEHRAYRAHLRPLFSARSASTVVPRLEKELEKAAHILRTCQAEDKPLNIQCLYRAFTSDIVCDALFAENLDFIGTGKEYHPFVAALDRFTAITWLVVQFPWMKSIQFYLPTGWGEKLTPEFTDFKQQCAVWWEKAKERQASGALLERKVLFDYYLELQSNSQSGITTVPQPMEDSFNLLTAGTESTAYSLSCITFHVLSNPHVLVTLRKELDESADFIRHSFDPKKIQALPYLTAVIKEALRLSTAVPGSLPRVTPPGGATVGSVHIPEGTVVSVSHLMVTQNQTIFPEPTKYRPDRWLGENGKNLEKWNVGFSKGPRRCIGMNLAYLELYSCISYLFSRFEMELFQTDEASMQWVDRISARNLSDVKIKVLGDRWL